MTRNLKAMGLAVVAVLALGAVFASAASARFEAESTPVTLTVSSNGVQIRTDCRRHRSRMQHYGP